MAEPRKEVLADGVEIWLGDCREVLLALLCCGLESKKWRSRRLHVL